VIYFVGAGAGDPELITFKGYKLLKEADLVVYAGSLVNEKILEYCKPEARLVNSAFLNLEEILAPMIEAYEKGEKVVRLHTGDPSLYGAIGEQMEVLKEKNIPFTIVPGVSSFLAAAASLQREYTIPDKTQTLIITRMEGRTPVPDKEKLASLAVHQASMAIFLSVGMIEQVVAELLKGYSPDTPAAVVAKASWPEEKIIKGSLKDLSNMTKEAGITKTALILVGDFLQSTGLSKLYDKGFSHEFRNSK
jgi:precorrin-4/cobalt-precorrin-4 C11-methyltransferase